MALPSGYRELSYIKSSGTQYIDIGFKPNQNTRMVLEAASTEGKSDNNVYLFGCDAGFGTNGFSVSTWTAGFGSATSTSDFDWSDGEKHIIDLNCGTLAIDGTVKWTATATFQSAYNAYVMSMNRSGNTVMPFTGKLFSCKVYDNGTLIRDCIPAKRTSDSVVGLYDVVNGVFYTNAGTGSFVGVITTGPVDGVGVSIVQATSYGIVEGKTIVEGTSYDITEGKTLVDGTGYDISFGPSVIPVTITGSGAATKCQVVINGQTYTSAASGIEVSAGDVIKFRVYSAQKSTPGKVIINGEVVASITGTVTGNGITHEWTVPEGCASISIQLYIAKGSSNRVLYTTATVTTT